MLSIVEYNQLEPLGAVSYRVLMSARLVVEVCLVRHHKILIHCHNPCKVVKYYPYFTDEASETGRLSDSPRVTQQVIDRAGIGTEFLIPNPVLGLLGHATSI